MAKIATDRTTLDLFAGEKRPGRPKTNPLPREEQLRLNKRNQIRRDKTKGLKRIECKVTAELYSQLDARAQALQLTRSALIEQLLSAALAR
ncbi:MAG TPA: LexA regulated protein [Rheinheimera sp.]|uniref:LexA regulated protein n=1 Tax=unclassified Rheinheimera TaxID=115860 RepID=UPI000EE55CD0|nr:MULTISPECIES: LexA regulated protein [unclassified Rheinheimera]MCT6700726.1 LexA regulated protein [Rheinheimera sp. 4Y26]HCU66305.1 LexA regulated protein [Rheinheimera sp.]